MAQIDGIAVSSPINQKNAQLGSSIAWLIWTMSAIFYFYEFCLQSSPSVMVPELMQAFHADATQLGRLSAYYFYAYAIMQIPVGLLLDRYGPRISMTLACLICATGAILFSHTQLLWQAELARFLMGFGSAFAVVGSMKIAMLWFEPRRFALLTGFLVMFGMLGAIGGQAPLEHFVKYFGWQHAMQVLAYSGLALAVLIFLVVKNGVLFEEQRAAAKGARFKWVGLKTLLTCPQVWLMALYGGFMYAPTPAFGELWGVPYIMSVFDVSRTAAAQTVSMIFVGWAIGSPLYGFLADRSGKRLSYMWVSTITSFILMALILLVLHHHLFLMKIALLLFGIASSGFVLIFTVAKETMSPELGATTAGFINTLNTLIPAWTQVGIGLLLDYYWHGQANNGIRLYSQANYHHAALVLLAAIFIAMMLLGFIRHKIHHAHLNDKS